jgi:hypothetical protein
LPETISLKPSLSISAIAIDLVPSAFVLMISSGVNCCALLFKANKRRIKKW